MSERTTYSDLARCLNDIADRLKTTVPPLYMVSDGGTLSCIRDAATALVEQDRKIGQLTIELREARYGKQRSA